VLWLLSEHFFPQLLPPLVTVRQFNCETNQAGPDCTPSQCPSADSDRATLRCRGRRLDVCGLPLRQAAKPRLVRGGGKLCGRHWIYVRALGRPSQIILPIPAYFGRILLLVPSNHARYFATFCITSGTFTTIGITLAWCPQPDFFLTHPSDDDSRRPQLGIRDQEGNRHPYAHGYWTLREHSRLSPLPYH
jgi:hypothetical protein